MRHSKASSWRGSAGRFAFVAVLSAVLSVLVGTEPALASGYAAVVDADSPTVFAPLEQGSTTLDFPSGSCTTAGDTVTGAQLVLGGGASLAGGTSSYGVGCIAGQTSTYYTLGSAFTLEAWFDATSSHSGCEPLVTTWGNNTWIPTICLNWGQSNRTIRVDPGAHNCDVPNVGGNFAAGSHYVVASFSGSTLSIYYDGVIPATGNNNGPCTYTESSVPGAMCWVDAGGGFYQNNNQSTCSNANNAFCNGGSTPCVSGGSAQSGTSVGEVAVYTYALTQAQVTSHYAGRNGGPAKQLFASSTPQQVKIGAHWTVTLNSTDSGGNDVTAQDTYTWTLAAFNPPGGSVTCGGYTATASTSPYATTISHVVTGHTLDCSAPQAGNVTLGFTSANVTNTTVETSVLVGAPPSQFEIRGPQTGTVGQKLSYTGYSFQMTTGPGGAVNFVDVSGSDSYTIASHANQTCAVSQFPAGNPLGGTGLHYFAVCSWDTAGSYTLTATDSYGFTSQLNVVIGSPSAATTCGNTDLGCWLNQIWDALSRLAQIPGDIVAGIYNLLFSSQQGGPSFIDLSPLTTNVWPTVACRSGQTPTAPDNVNCYAFPFSIPSDLGVFLGMLNATPSAPTMAINWDFPLWTGTTLHESATIDPTVVLTNTTMMYVRDAELVLFIIGTAMGTWRFLQLVGVD